MLLFGKRLDTSKTLNYALQAIFGINISTATKLCAMLGVSPKIHFSQLKIYHFDKLAKICSEQIDNGKYRQIIANIKQLILIKQYRGVRHMFGLPARGQRTRTNSVTSKKVMSKILRLNLKKNKQIS